MTAHDPATDPDEVMSAINIVPFVDIVLVLLVVFMVTSAAIVRASFKVDLPKAAAAGQEVVSTLNLVLTAEGALLMDGSAVEPGVLAVRVREAVARDEEVQAVIDADAATRYGAVVRLIDLIKGEGVTGFALNIERGVPEETRENRATDPRDDRSCA